jgi:hypothetical protein
MLTAEQTFVARQAFEADRRALTVTLNLRIERADAKKARERLGPFEPLLERRPDGEYRDANRQVQWITWLKTWEAALASVGLVTP